MINPTKRQFTLGAICAGFCSLIGTPTLAQGKVHTVEMLNKSADGKDRQVFGPPVLQVNVGDSVRFVATAKGHNSASNKDMLPAGAKAWKGKIGQNVEVNFTVSGVYGYHCVPHRSTGMVGLILVGDVSAADLKKAQGVRQRGKAKSRYESYFETAKGLLG